MIVWRVIDWVVDTVCALTLIMLSVTITMQIYYRYILGRPLLWTLDVALFLFVWLIWLGGARGMRDEIQLRLKFAEEYLPFGIRRFLIPLHTFFSIIILVLVVVYGIKVTAFQASAEYAAIPFHRHILYAVAPVVGTLMIIYLVRVFTRQITIYWSAKNAEQALKGGNT